MVVCARVTVPYSLCERFSKIMESAICRFVEKRGAGRVTCDVEFIFPEGMLKWLGLRFCHPH